MGVRLHVNGVAKDLDAAPDDALLWVVRDQLGLMAAKYGCGLEQCGACRVLVDGAPMFACALPVGDVGEREVTTLEGLLDDPHAKAVIDALLARNAGQCGFCLPGIAVSLIELARRVESATRDEINAALEPHLCRCGSQPRIVAAALDVLGSAEDRQ